MTDIVLPTIRIEARYAVDVLSFDPAPSRSNLHIVAQLLLNTCHEPIQENRVRKERCVNTSL